MKLLQFGLHLVLIEHKLRKLFAVGPSLWLRCRWQPPPPSHPHPPGGLTTPSCFPPSLPCPLPFPSFFLPISYVPSLLQHATTPSSSPFPVFSPLLFQFFFYSFISAFFELGLNYLLSHAFIQRFSPAFTAFCYLLFFHSSLLAVIFHPHPIMCSDMWSLIRNWISNPLPSLTFSPPTGMPEPHRGHVFFSSAIVKVFYILP